MLEIILLISLCRRLGTILRGKGRNPTGYQFMLVACWFAGEILGAIAAATVIGGPGAIYGFALLGAAAGAAISFIIAKNLQPADGSQQRGFPVATYNDEI